MANRLVKASQLIYTPAVKGVVGRPAYCTTTSKNVPVVRYEQVFASGMVSYTGSNAPNYSIGYSTSVTYKNVTTTVCFPAIEAVAAVESSYAVDDQRGWNAGARSIVVIPAGKDAYATFVIPSTSIGVACGFALPSAPVDNLASIRHGIIATGDTFRVIEQGVQVADSLILVSSTVPLRIQRVGGEVTYYIGDWSYTSLKSSVSQIGLTAVLYSAGDYVDAPAMGGIENMRATSSWGWDSWDTAYNLSATSDWGWAGSAAVNEEYARASFPLQIKGGEHDYGNLYLSVGDITVQGQGGFVEVLGSGISFVLSVSLVGVASAIYSGGGSVEIDAPILRGSDEDYGNGYLYLSGPDIRGFSTEEAEGTGTFSQVVGIVDGMVFDPVLIASFADGFSIGDTFDLLLVIDGVSMDYLVPGDGMSPSMVIEALIEAGLVFRDSPSITQEAATQYATNLQTGGVGRYQGYDYLGFAEIGMDTYGWKADGLYKLGEPVSEDSPLNAFVEFAAEDFGTTLRKRVDTVYVGVNADGELLLKMSGDDTPEVVYCARQYGPTARANIGKGFTSRHWRMRLDFIEVTQADIDSVEWVVMPTTRRTTR